MPKTFSIRYAGPPATRVSRDVTELKPPSICCSSGQLSAARRGQRRRLQPGTFDRLNGGAAVVSRARLEQPHQQGAAHRAVLRGAAYAVSGSPCPATFEPATEA